MKNMKKIAVLLTAALMSFPTLTSAAPEMPKPEIANWDRVAVSELFSVEIMQNKNTGNCYARYVDDFRFLFSKVDCNDFDIMTEAQIRRMKKIQKDAEKEQRRQMWAELNKEFGK